MDACLTSSLGVGGVGVPGALIVDPSNVVSETFAFASEQEGLSLDIRKGGL